jgi:hypothetical protein
VKLEYIFKLLLETYLSNVPLLNKSLGVQVEVVLDSPQALVLLEKCLWIAGNKHELQGEQYGKSPHRSSSMRRPYSASTTKYGKTLLQIG